jgi:predicted amidohydrolase YtcJ
LIFYNGVVLTMVRAAPRAQSLAVRGGKILAIGEEGHVLGHQGPETILVDLDGRTLMPGFVDPHSHILSSAGVYDTDVEGAQSLILSNGITTMAEMTGSPDLIQQLQMLHRNGRLRVRVSVYMPYVDNCGNVEGDWYTGFTPAKTPGEMLRIGGVKIFADGGSCKAPAVSFEYPNGVGRGDLFFSQEEMNTMISDVHSNGYQVAVHAIGDRAIEQVLTAIDAALEGGPNKLRHRIEHNSVLSPDMYPRYQETGVVALIFGAFPTCFFQREDSEYKYTIPEAYETWEWPWRGLLDANPGGHFAWHGDDPPIPPINPIIELWGFVTRRDVAADGSICEPPAWMAAQTISVEEALRLMTIESAYALFRDEEVGSLEVNKFADLIVLSQDPIAVAANDINDIEVWMTMVAGKVEYCAEGHAEVCP